MKTEYSGCTIEVTVEQGKGLWAAEAWIWSGHPGSLLDKGEVEGCVSQGDAEEAVLGWGRARVDLFVLREL